MMWWMLVMFIKASAAAFYGGIIQYPIYRTAYIPVHYQVPHYISYIQPPQIRYSAPFIQTPMMSYSNYYPWWRNSPNYYPWWRNSPNYYPWWRNSPHYYPWGRNGGPPYNGQYTTWHNNRYPWYGHGPWWHHGNHPWYNGHHPWYNGHHPWWYHHYSSLHYNGPPQRSLWWWMHRQHNPYWYLYHHRQFPRHQHPWWWYRLHYGNGHYRHPWWWYWSHHSQPSGYNGGLHYWGRGSIGGGYYRRSIGYYGNGHGQSYRGHTGLSYRRYGGYGSFWNRYHGCPRYTIHMHHLDTRSWWTCRYQDPSLCLAELTQLTNNMIRSNRCRRHSCTNLRFSRQDLRWLMYRYRHLLPRIHDHRIPFSRRMLIMANLILSKLNRWCYYDLRMMQQLTGMVMRRHYYYMRYHHNLRLHHWWSTRHNLWHSAGWWRLHGRGSAAVRSAMGMTSGYYNGRGYYGGRWSPYYNYYSGLSISGGVPGRSTSGTPGASQFPGSSTTGSTWSSSGSTISNTPGVGSAAPGGTTVTPNTLQPGTLRQRESCKLCSKQLAVINNRLLWLLSAGSHTQQQLSYLLATRDNLQAKLPNDNTVLGQYNAMIQQLTNQMIWLSWNISKLRGFAEQKGCTSR